MHAVLRVTIGLDWTQSIDLQGHFAIEFEFGFTNPSNIPLEATNVNVNSKFVSSRRARFQIHNYLARQPVTSPPLLYIGTLITRDP